MKRFRIPSEVHVREFDGELVILDMARGDYFGINEVGARFWAELERHGGSFDEAVSACAPHYDVERATLDADLLELVKELTQRGLLEELP